MGLTFPDRVRFLPHTAEWRSVTDFNIDFAAQNSKPSRLPA